MIRKSMWRSSERIVREQRLRNVASAKALLVAAHPLISAGTRQFMRGAWRPFADMHVNALPLRHDQDGYRGGDSKITLTFERSPGQWAAATLHMPFMGGFAAFLRYYALYGLLHAPLSRSLPVALFFVAGAAFAAWNGSTSLLDPDYTAIFDLDARSVTVTESSVTGWK